MDIGRTLLSSNLSKALQIYALFKITVRTKPELNQVLI